MEITTIGLDLAESVFHLRAIDADSAMVRRKNLWRGVLLDAFAKVLPCLVGMGACATPHHGGREIRSDNGNGCGSSLIARALSQ